MKKLFTLSIIILIAFSIKAQSYNLQYVVVASDQVAEGNHDLKIQIKATSADFNLGVSNLTFSYETDAIYSHHAPDDGSKAPTLLIAHNFNSGAYSAMDLTEPQAGIISLNINYNFETSGNGETVGTTDWVDVATIRFVIKQPSILPNFTWQDDYTQGGVNPVLIFDDATPANAIIRNSVQDNNAPLPVDLTLFQVNWQNEKVAQVNWQTASEINNSHFVVQRSYDGLAWEELASIEGKGTMMSASNYTYSDKALKTELALNQKIYYRLKQVDFDGSFEYSPIKSLNIDENAQIISQFGVFPNPAVGKNINLSEVSDYRIYSSTGKLMIEAENCTQVDVSGLENGVYVVSNSQGASQLFVKK